MTPHHHAMRSAAMWVSIALLWTAVLALNGWWYAPLFCDHFGWWCR